MTEDRKPVFVQCKACDHVWICLYTPMDLAVAASIMMDMHCPKCGNGSSSICFKAEDKADG